MAQSLVKIALAALVLCSVPAVEAQAHKPVEPEAPVLSADDTLAYINTTLHNYPSLEFVASGCPGDEQVVTISEDRRSLVLKQIFFKPIKGGRCDDVQTLRFSVFSLNLAGLASWSKQGQHSSFLLDCANRTGCFSRRSDAYTSAVVANQWFLNMTAPDHISDGMTKAFQHLVDSLIIEADGRVDGSDPFVKHDR